MAISKTKKLLFAGLVLAGAGSLIYLFTQTRPREVQVPPPQIEPLRQYNTQITSSVTKENFRLPQRMEVYASTANPYTLDQGREIASRLGFTTTPSILDDRRGSQVVTWYDQQKSLRLVLPRGEIDYKTAAFPQGSVPQSFDNQRLNEIALAFLVDNGFISAGQVELAQITRQFIETETETGPSDFSAYSVRYRQQVGGLPIVNLTEGVGTISVYLDSDNHIFRVFVDKITSFEPAASGPTIDYSEFSGRVSQAKIQFIQREESTPTTDPDQIEITAVKVGYLKETGGPQTLLQPILILSGTARWSNTSAPATLYLPALKQTSN